MIERVTHQGWFSRIKSAIGGIFFGLIFIIGAIVLQFWNEGRTLHQRQMLDAGKAEVVSVDPASPPSGAAMLAHVTGEAKADGTRLDPVFNQPAEGIALRRQVEMYQWKERKESREETKIGGGTVTRTTYHYDQVWDDDLIDSDRFEERVGHENPERFPFDNETWRAERVHISAIDLAPETVAEIGGWKPMAPAMDRLPANLAASFAQDGEWLTTSSGSPRIGDVRINFARSPDGVVSAVGRLQGTSLGADKREQGELLLVERGSHTADQLFDAAISRNAGIGWALRFAGFVISWVGFGLVFAPIAVFADVLPIAGRFTRMVNGLVSGVLAALLSFFAIISGWLYHRPWALGLILIGLAALIYAFMRRKPSMAAAVSPPPPPPPPPPAP